MEVVLLKEQLPELLLHLQRDHVVQPTICAYMLILVVMEQVLLIRLQVHLLQVHVK